MNPHHHSRNNVMVRIAPKIFMWSSQSLAVQLMQNDSLRCWWCWYAAEVTAQDSGKTASAVLHDGSWITHDLSERLIVLFLWIGSMFLFCVSGSFKNPLTEIILKFSYKFLWILFRCDLIRLTCVKSELCSMFVRESFIVFILQERIEAENISVDPKYCRLL